MRTAKRASSKARCGPKDLGAAEVAFQLALAAARSQHAKTFELRAAKQLARLWCDQGRSAVARSILVQICGVFTDGLRTPDLEEAKIVLKVLLIATGLVRLKPRPLRSHKPQNMRPRWLLGAGKLEARPINLADQYLVAGGPAKSKWWFRPPRIIAPWK